MRKSCEKFKTPVTGGNVSFYNQSLQNGRDVPVFPTPTIGMMGIVTDKKHITSLAFQNEADLIYLIGESKNDINSSEYLYSYHKVKNSPAPYFDLEVEFKLQNAIKDAIQHGLLNSAHDCADGGLFISLFESGMPNNLGFEINSVSGIRKDAFLFGEAQSRAVVSVSPAKKEEFESFISSRGVKVEMLGEVKGKNMRIDGENFGEVMGKKEVFETALAAYLN